MDCETARLFLHFDCPGERDLDGHEADELHAHLEQCSACHSLSLAARHFDQHLGRAMRAVEVPGDLQSRLMARLAAERRALQRRRLGRFARATAVAACLLLLVWAGYAFLINPTPRTISLDTVSEKVTPGQYKALLRVNEILKRQGAPACAPHFVKYEYLFGMPAMTELPGYAGVKVPQLTFAHKDHRAFILALDSRRFEVDELQNIAPGYDYTLSVRKDKPFVYLIFHNSSNNSSWEDWLEGHTDDE